VTVWLVFTGGLLLAGLAPALVLASRAPAVPRLVGLQFAGAVSALLLVALTVVVDQPSYLIVPLAMVLLSYAGTLVYTRLLEE